MNYKLKNTNGKVTFLLRTGKDLVKKSDGDCVRTTYYRQRKTAKIRC